jgi:hypothetical protein
MLRGARENHVPHATRGPGECPPRVVKGEGRREEFR